MSRGNCLPIRIHRRRTNRGHGSVHEEQSIRRVPASDAERKSVLSRARLTEVRKLDRLASMKAVPTPLSGVLLLKPKVFGDTRGFFLESYNERMMTDLGIRERF